MKKKFTGYLAAVKYLEDLARLPIARDYLRRGAQNPKIFLERARCLLKLLGDPHRGFKYLHITGTAGKGSVTAILHNILKLSGKRVGSFYSPFCSTSIEKIKVHDKLIAPGIFTQLVEQMKPAIEQMKTSAFGRPSYFECFFALALLYFKKTRCQWVVLEVGLGGAFDATNAIKRSEISAITNIGFDHTHILGKTLTKIARDKAGIIKPRSHFFTTETRPRLLKIFKRRCRVLKTHFHKISPLIKPSLQPSPLKGEGARKSGLQTDQNIILATAIARRLNISGQIIAKAISNTKLPCRFEMIQTKPLVILDGAHNPLKIKNVIHNLKNLTYAKLYIIFACAANKDAKTMIALLKPAADEIVFTQFYCDREPDPAAAWARLAAGFSHCQIDRNPQSALNKILKKMSGRDALLVTGSFYLTGGLRKKWVTENEILKRQTAC